MSSKIFRGWKTRFEHRPGMHRPRHLRNGAIAILLFAFLLVVAGNRGIPFWPKGGKTVWAHFDRAQSLRVDDPVRVAGVEVGSVSRIERPPRGRGAMVELRILDKGVRLRDDARASIRWRTLLGRNLYVELDPGSRSAASLTGEIAPSHTESQVELDEVLRPLDASGRLGLQRIVAAADGSLHGRAASRAIDGLARSAPTIAAGLAPLRGERPGDDLPTLVRGAARTMRALESREANLVSLIDSGVTTLGVTAARSADIGTTLDRAPSTLDDVRQTMIGLRTTLPLLDAVTDRLRPGARRLDRAVTSTRPLLDRATPFLRDARVLLRGLEPALHQLGRRFSPSASATLVGLSPTLRRLRTQVLPYLDRKDEAMQLKVFQTIGPALAGASAFLQTTDEQGAFVQFEAGAGESLAPSLPCHTMFTDPNSKKLVVCEQLGDYLKSLLSSPSSPPESDPADGPSSKGGG